MPGCQIIKALLSSGHFPARGSDETLGRTSITKRVIVNKAFTQKGILLKC